MAGQAISVPHSLPQVRYMMPDTVAPRYTVTSVTERIGRIKSRTVRLRYLNRVRNFSDDDPELELLNRCVTFELEREVAKDRKSRAREATRG